MSIYIVILLFLLVCSLLNPYIRKDIRMVTNLFFAGFFVLALLGGLRKNVGFDYWSYAELYKQSAELYNMKEKGFIWLVEIFNNLHLPFVAFCIFFSFLSVYLAFRFILRNSPYVFFSILMYFSLGNYYFSTFNVVRQALAAVIFMNLLPSIEKKSFWSYFIILLITAWTVHFTVLILIPLYFFLRKEWSIFSKILFLGNVIVLNSVLIVIIENSPYSIYLKFESFASAVSPTYYLMAMFGLTVCFFEWKHPNWQKEHILFCNLNYLTILLIYLVFANENTPLVMVINRILGYFTLIYVVLLPMLFAEMKLFSNRCIFIVLCSIIFAFLFYWALSQNGENHLMIPYTTIFS